MLIFFQSTFPIPETFTNDLSEFGFDTGQLQITGATVWKSVYSDLPTEMMTGLSEICFQRNIDVTFLSEPPKTLEDFKLLAMDMDSTLITIECIDEIAAVCGKKAEVSAITELAMQGELDFTQSLKRRVGLLKGIPVTSLEDVYQTRLRLNPGAEQLLEKARQYGLRTLLMSGGFTFFTEKLKTRLGLDYTFANVLGTEGDFLTGEVIGGIVDATEKRRIVERTCAELGIATTQAIVIGDGANDLEAMSVAGLSVAYHAKPVVRARANVALNHVGLDGLLNILS